MSATKGQFFKKTASIHNDKATATDSLSKSIVAAETIAREKKTEALRALRLQQEALEEPKAVKPVKEKKKAVRRTRV
ncbi:hypothetical protein [Rhizobium sp. BR 314]|uniref:hypothetical protein n=1 Tax=Rhizobium sp. BR 314 TaxID=3040013 RepID=UPI0039BFC02D